MLVSPWKTSPLARLNDGRLPAVALLATVSVLVVWVSRSGLHLVPRDFLTYRYAAQQAAAGHDIYAGTISGPGLAGQPFTYTPFAALAFRGFGLLSWPVSYFLWAVASLTGLGLVIHALLRKGPADAALGLLAACATTVVFTNVRDGQVNILLMILCLLDLRGRPTSGIGIGLAAAIKLTPALFMVHLALTRQWRALGTSILTAALATGLAAIVHPRLSREFFGTIVWNLQDRVRLDHPLSYWGNASLSGGLHAWDQWPAPLIPLAVIGLLAAALACARIAHTRGSALNAFLIVGLAAPAASPYAWAHHYIFLIPAVVVVLRSITDPKDPRIGWLAVIWAVIMLGPGSGHWLVQHGSEWLLPLAVVLREGPLLASGLCIWLLVTEKHQTDVHPGALRVEARR